MSSICASPARLRLDSSAKRRGLGCGLGGGQSYVSLSTGIGTKSVSFMYSCK